MFRSLLSPFWSPSDEISDANKSSLSDKDSQDSQELSPEDGEIDSNPDINGQRDDQHREEVTTIHKKASYVSFPPLLSDSKYDALPVESEDDKDTESNEVTPNNSICHLDELYSFIGIEGGKRSSTSMQLPGGHCQWSVKYGSIFVSG